MYVPYGVGKSSPERFQITLAQTPQRSFQWASAGTHATPAPNRAHSGSHAETGVFRMGVVSLSSERSARFGNPAWPGARTTYFAAFGPWPGVFLKNTESLRNSDALMRVAVPRRRGLAGLRDLFCFCRNCVLYALRSELSVRAKEGGYHYPRRALRVAETPDGRLSKRLICSFLVSPIYICERPRRALPISALIQIDCCWISCGHTACP